MNRKSWFFVIVGTILVVLNALYILLGIEKHGREAEIARNPGNNVLTRELDEYRILNQRQQRGILVVEIILLIVAATWWTFAKIQRPKVGPPARDPDQPPSR